MKGSNQYIVMILHLEGTSVMYSTLHCLIKYGQIKLGIIVLHCLRTLCNGVLDFFHNWPVPTPPYDSSLTPFLGHFNFSFFKIEVLPGVWEYAWLRTKFNLVSYFKMNALQTQSHQHFEDSSVSPPIVVVPQDIEKGVFGHVRLLGNLLKSDNNK